MLKSWQHLSPVLRVAHELGARIELRFPVRKPGLKPEEIGVWLDARKWHGDYGLEWRVHPDDHVLRDAAIRALADTQHTFEYAPDADDPKVRFTVPKIALGSAIPIHIPYGFGCFVYMDQDGHIQQLAVGYLVTPGSEDENDKQFLSISRSAFYAATSLEPS